MPHMPAPFNEALTGKAAIQLEIEVRLTELKSEMAGRKHRPKVEDPQAEEIDFARMQGQIDALESLLIFTRGIR